MSWCPALLFDGDRSLPAICSIDYRLRVKEEGSAEISRWRDCAEFPLTSPSPPFCRTQCNRRGLRSGLWANKDHTATYLPKVFAYLTLICSLIHTCQGSFSRCL